MCVITFKPHDVEIDERDIVAMAEANPDGMGFIVPDEGSSFYFSKGYFDINDILTVNRDLRGIAACLHFRLATHGETNEAMCHPFVVSRSEEEILQVEGTTNRPLLMHNGIISGFGVKGLSDTAHFVRDVLSQVPRRAAKASLKATGCKYALFRKGRMSLIGGFQEYRGLQVSNTHFNQRLVVRGNSAIGRRAWIWDDVSELQEFIAEGECMD